MRNGKLNICYRLQPILTKISNQELVNNSKLIFLNIKVLIKTSFKTQSIIMFSLIFINKNNQKLFKKMIMIKISKSDQALCKLASNMKNISKLELEIIIKLQIFHKLSQNPKLQMLRISNK